MAPEITNEDRLGDVRHCFADITRAIDVLGYTPRVELNEGLEGMTGWLASQVTIDHLAAQHTARRKPLTTGAA